MRLILALALSAAAGAADAHVLAPGEPVGWNWAPWLVLPLIAALLAYAGGAWRLAARRNGNSFTRVIGHRRAAAFAAGMAVLAAALVSPLDALADKLFWVHMVQHMLLLMVAPPLLVYGRPAIGWLWAFRHRGRRRIGRVWRASRLDSLITPLKSPLGVAVLWSLVLFVWHLPAPYALALENEMVHALDHASFLAAGLALANLVVHPYGRRALSAGAAILLVALLGLESTLIGAVLAFSEQPLYAAHIHTAPAYGLTAVQDQRVAGLIMWVPAGMLQVITLCGLFFAWLRQAEQRAARHRPWTATLPCIALAAGVVLALAGCSQAAPAGDPVRGDPERGAAMIVDYGCTGCHRIPGIDGPHGLVGPPLTKLERRSYIAGVLINTPPNLIHWIRNPQQVAPDSAMPDLGVSARDARDIAAYLYSLD